MTSPLLRHALRLASVTGAFNPDDLADAAGLDRAQMTERRALMQGLSRHVTEIIRPAYGWCLTPDARRSELERMISADQILRSLGAAPCRWDDDLMALHLRAFMRGEQRVPDISTYPDTPDGIAAALVAFGAVLDAVQFARCIPWLDDVPLAAIEAEAKRLIVEAQRRRDLLVVLPSKHFGYDAERERLSAFLRGGSQTADVISEGPEAEAARLAATRPLFVSGIGGVGKSALLARLLRYWQRRRDGPLTIVLDFDRRQLNSGSPFELMREFLRQAVAGLPDKGFAPEIADEIAAGLLGLRHELLAEVATTYQSERSLLASILPDRFDCAWASHLRGTPIAIIFDSFEALDRRGGTNVKNVLRFEALLRDRQVLPNLRSVFSGRAEPLAAENMTTWFGPVTRRIELKGLRPGDGAELIAATDARLAKAKDHVPLLANATQRLDIARALRGHPLALLMAVKFIHSRPEELDALVADLRKGGGRNFKAEFAQVFLYERILDRIAEDEVRQLAHPGLVLRTISADLIRLVAAGPCLGRDDVPTEAEAEALYRKLAEEYWLVEGDGSGDLRHRPDLRHLMLPGLFAEPRQDDSPEKRRRKRALRAKALRVTEAARDYYRHGPPREMAPERGRWSRLPRDERQANSLYYEALLSPETPPSFEFDTANLLQRELGADMDALPIAWRARVDALLDRDVEEGGRETLTEDLREKASVMRNVRQSKSGQAGARPKTVAPSSAQRRPLTGEAQRGLSTSAAELEGEIAWFFAQADFRAVIGHSSAYFDALRANDRAFDALQRSVVSGFFQTAMWRLLLSHRVVGKEVDVEGLQGSVLPGSPLIAYVDAIQCAARGEPVDLASLAPDEFRSPVTSLEGFRHRSAEVHRRPWQTGESKRPKLGLAGPANALALATSGRFTDMAERLIPKIPELKQLLGQLWSNRGVRLHRKDPRGFGGVPRAAAIGTTLADFGRLYLQASDLMFELQAGDLVPGPSPVYIARVFRGLSPDLYDPLVTLLEGTPPEVIVSALEPLEAEALFWPRELRFSASDDEQPDTVDDEGYVRRRLRSDVIRTVVETADRTGLLRAFIRRVSEEDPRVEPVLTLYDAITDWFFAPLAVTLDPVPEP
ncbi:MAG: ATP-binding protein [Pseudomonadota bacterium]